MRWHVKSWALGVTCRSPPPSYQAQQDCPENGLSALTTLTRTTGQQRGHRGGIITTSIFGGGESDEPSGPSLCPSPGGLGGLRGPGRCQNCPLGRGGATPLARAGGMNARSVCNPLLCPQLFGDVCYTCSHVIEGDGEAPSLCPLPAPAPVPCALWACGPCSRARPAPPVPGGPWG